MTTIDLKIKRIVPEGKGFGLFEGKPVYVLGAFPGEKVKAEIYKRKNDYCEAKLIEVIEKNNERIDPQENHFMSCSPWQAITYDYQIELKKEIIEKCFHSLAGIDIKLDNFYKSPKIFNYRNKLEFSFGEEEPRGKVFLAFHVRGSHKHMVKLENGCILGHEKMNEVALQVLDEINKAGLEEFDLKSLVVRQSLTNGEVIALLLVKNEKERVQKALETFKDTKIHNLTIALSDYRSPIARIDKVLFQNGKDYLIEDISGLKFKYYADSFFQNNIELFETALSEIKKFLISNSYVLELYSGVGSIGLSIANEAKEITAVEIIESSVKSSEENAKLNNIDNFKSILLPAEKIDKEILNGKDVLVLDPPRTGLHQKVVDMVVEKKPKQIIYLSCNPITQASDFNKLKEIYDLKYISGFDFYPNTPHMENLIILELK